MRDDASIQRFTLSSATDVIAVSGGEGIGRLIIRVTEDTRVALSELEVDYNYIMFAAGTVMILDPPNLLSSSNLWFRLDTATSGVVEILRC
jgi:hypothetical protein